MASWNDPERLRTKPIAVKFTLRPELHALVREEAIAEGMSMAQVIRRAIREYFTRKPGGNA